MFSRTTEYALRAVVYLASRHGSPSTIQQLAEATRVPHPDYLSKVMQGLRRAGLVRSQRGVGGGFTLTGAPEDVTIYDVVQAVEPIQRITKCPLGIKDHINLCPLHRRLDEAMDRVENALKETSLAELLVEPSRKRGVPIPLCPWPAEGRQ